MKPIFTLALACGLLAPTATADQSHFSYFNLEKPGTTPQAIPFSDIFGDEFDVGNPVFSPDGREFYFTDGKSLNIYRVHISGTEWSTPKKASFSDAGRNWEPFITADNKTLFFGSTREPGSGPHNGRIWRTKRQADGEWGTPELVIDRDTTGGFWFPNSPDNGQTLYFGATLEDSLGEGDMYKAVQDSDGWKVSHLEPPFNTPDFEWDPFISPDGSYMIFESRRDGGLGGTDIYVSFQEGDTFGPPVHLDAPINSDAFETAATITPDGAFMIYTVVPNGQPPQIYWVSTDVITRLRDEGK